MPVARYRGRTITSGDVAFIRELIAAHPGASRRALSLKLCAAWGWVQQNGAFRDAVCRGLLLQLHRAGQIELPSPQWVSDKPRVRHHPRSGIALDRRPVEGSLASLGPLTFRQVRRTDDEPLFDALIEQHHPLGYTQPVGEQLKMLVFAAGRPVAAFAWSSAPRHLGPRDRYIGWSAQARRRGIHLVAYNSRFLIPPWVAVRHLASHVLGQMVRRLSGEWERLYGHRVHFAETFVDPARYRGTCYRAANWVRLGRTTGRGKDAPTKRPTRSIKDVLGYPLHPRFRALLTGLG